MAGPNPAFESLSSADLLAATRGLVRQSQGVEAQLLSHLGEIDERKLYLDCASPSMFAFCVHELGFSEDAAYNRITVARAGRRLPAVLSERPGRALPEAPPDREEHRARRSEARPLISPLSEETYKIQFTASRVVRDKLREAQGLLRHRVPDGDVATIIGKALDLLIDEVKKQRFAVGRMARQGPRNAAALQGASGEVADPPSSRHIPNVPRWIRADASARGGPDPAPVSRPQSARGGADVRALLHGTGPRTPD